MWSGFEPVIFRFPDLPEGRQALLPIQPPQLVVSGFDHWPIQTTKDLQDWCFSLAQLVDLGQ